jgi:hypothetical protein
MLRQWVRDQSGRDTEQILRKALRVTPKQGRQLRESRPADGDASKSRSAKVRRLQWHRDARIFRGGI